jgi:multisubunit Na+/H+ antiporter MnhC subunit
MGGEVTPEAFILTGIVIGLVAMGVGVALLIMGANDEPPRKITSHGEWARKRAAGRPPADRR